MYRMVQKLIMLPWRQLQVQTRDTHVYSRHRSSPHLSVGDVVEFNIDLGNGVRTNPNTRVRIARIIVTRQPNGSNVTFYDLHHPDSASFHVDIQSIMEGCIAEYLTPIASASQMFPQPTPMWHEELIHTASNDYPLEAVLDTAGTFHAINTVRYFIEGSIRRSTVTTLFNSNASATCITSGLVQTKSVLRHLSNRRLSSAKCN